VEYYSDNFCVGIYSGQKGDICSGEGGGHLLRPKGGHLARGVTVVISFIWDTGGTLADNGQRI